MAERTSEADLNALREYLNSYAGEPNNRFSSYGELAFVDFFGREKYVFTHVNKSISGTPSFQLKGGKLFGKCPLITFSYYEIEKEIRVHKGGARNERDRQSIDAIVELLEERPYERLISNFEDLRIKTI